MLGDKLKIIISGGGTGGHVFPALAIANSLKSRFMNAEILFIGAKGRMEMEKVPEAGFKIEGLWISGLQRRLTLKNLMFPVKLICSLLKAKSIIKKFKPDIVIGVGGYASGPTLKMAIQKKIPTLIQEQNSYPGITNRLLANKVDKICVAYDGMEKYFPAEKIVKTGNPIRSEVIEIDGKRDEAISFFGLSNEMKTVLVIGGSQGALAINKSITGILKEIAESEIQLVWQTGNTYYTIAENAVTQIRNQNIKVHSFIKRMDLAYATADIVISRAGAIAISELCTIKKPVIFVPLPSATEDHQTKNAMVLVDQKAAILVKNNEANEQLGKILFELLKDENLQLELSKNIGKNAIKNADKLIVDEIVKLQKKLTIK